MSRPDEQRGRILFVHSDAGMLRSVRRSLRDQSYEVRTAANAHSALDMARGWLPEVVLMEFSDNATALRQFCQRLRAAANPQILAMLSSRPGHLRLAALAAGADDYVASPLTTPELLARIKLAMARAGDRQNEAVRRIETGDLLIELEERRVMVNGRERHLAIKEFELLRCLVLNANRVVSHGHLLQAIGGKGASAQNLRVYIRQLRKKLEPNPRQPRYIRTETRLGYRFRLDGSTHTSS